MQYQIPRSRSPTAPPDRPTSPPDRPTSPNFPKTFHPISTHGSNSTSALSDLTTLPVPENLDFVSHAHRRRASESSNFFPGSTQQRVKRPLSEHPSSAPHSPAQAHRPSRLLSLSDFRLSKVLGSGGTATVVRAEPVPWSNAAKAIPAKEIALKAVSKKGLSRRAQHYLAREIAIHRTVQDHPHIVSLYDVFDDASGIYLCLELLRGSDLYSVLKRERTGFSERVALSIIAQVLDALSYMHSQGCAHRDIKPENLMFTERPNLHGGKLPPVKIIDFGLASIRKLNASEKDRTSSEKCGTIRYAAPEIVTEASYIPEQSDIWSVGIVLYSIIAHRNPYTGKTEKEVLHQIKHSPLSFDSVEWESVAEDTKKLIRWCLTRKAADRPSATCVLKEVNRILHVLSGDELDASDEAGNSKTSRHKGAKGPQRQLDLSGFSSNVTREGSPSIARREKQPAGESTLAPPRSSSDDGTIQRPNFFDGLVKAWFTGSNSDRSRSDSSN